MTIADAFQSFLNDSKRRPNLNIRVDQGSDFYRNFFKTWLVDNEIDMYPTRRV